MLAFSCHFVYPVFTAARFSMFFPYTLLGIVLYAEMWKRLNKKGEEMKVTYHQSLRMPTTLLNKNNIFSDL